MLAPVFYVLPLGTITRKRLLPHAGRVVVRVGQKVSPSDVIAETSISRKHVIVDVAEQLQVPNAKLESIVKIKRGQKVAKGEIIAEIGGVFGREVRAPVDGRVAALAGGKLVLETGRAGIEVRAGVSGTVTEVIEGLGAVIRASGAVVQGVWGNGKIEAGVLLSLLEKPDDTLESSRLDVSQRGSVILAGHVSDPKTLKTAAELPVRGLVLSSMSSSLISLAMQAPYPILLIDGFGRRPMNQSAFKLLSTNVKRDIAVNAEFHRKMETRPEAFLSLPFTQEPPEPPEVEAFAEGQTVRIISMLEPVGKGVLVSLPDEQVTLANGVRTLAARVRLEAGDEILVPRSNLEVLV